MYTPLNYEQLNIAAGTYSPSTVKAYNNATYQYWERSLFQRACSTLEIELPDNFDSKTRDFLYYCLFKFGYVAFFDSPEFGLAFQPANISGYNFYYQPVKAIVSNPLIPTDKNEFIIGEDCELLKLTPDYMSTWDTISYFAEKLSTLDNAINMSLINNKFAFILGARNKQAAESLKKVLDLINKGEPAVIVDRYLKDDKADKDSPFQFLERSNLKQSYLTTDQLMDFQTILNNFDAEIGIPTVPYQKKERLVTSEADSRQIDSTSRSQVWFETLSRSAEDVNKMFNTNISVKLRYEIEQTPEEGGEEDVNS